jgi:glycosyltransferase involved in cell wall biosynthesis
MLAIKVPKDLRPGLVSIGLAVYNGGRYLREALDSLLAQEYQDFEIIISDNASQDETEEICREFAARDARITYHRSDQNKGPLWNAIRVYEMARGEYFMWAAHDDRRHPQYLSRCVPVLDNNPSALFCCTGVRLIDEVGNDVSETFPYQSYQPTGATPLERLRALISSACWLHVYSLMRTPALAQTVLGTHMWGADVVLMADLCLRGEGVGVPDKLFDYRYFAAKTDEDLAQSLGSSEVVVSVSWSDLAADLMESVLRSPLSFPEKLRLRWMIVVELCSRNSSIGRAMRSEGFAAASRALAEGKYRRALTLTFIRLLKLPTYFVERAVNSARYRGPKLKRALFPGERAPAGRK